MRYTFALIIFCCLIPSSLLAQERYQDFLFEEVKATTYTYFTKPEEALKVDVYEPTKDTAPQRPLLLYVHGGGFAGGKRDEDRHTQFCKIMAQKGYVAATMDYTLVMKGKSFSCDQAAPNKIETFRLTGLDISRAVRYFINQKEVFRIDTTKIVLLGSSAGAEAVLHAAYWNGCRKNNEEVILSDAFQYGGVISMAGAIVSLDFIRAKSAIPTQLFHGTCDNLVPYGAAPHHYCAVGDPGYLVLYGAYAIAEQLRNLGKPFYLVTGCQGRHEWNDKPLFEYVPEITNFVYQDILQNKQRQIHLVIPTGQDDCPNYPAFNFCTEE